MKQKKQVLLVMPAVPYTLYDWPIPPVGILYVSSYMKKMEISVHCLNLGLCDGEPMDELKQVILDKQIDIVATGDLVVNYDVVKEIVDCAKAVSENIITIIGGGLVTHSPEEAMQLIPNADFGVIGEGEVTDSELVLALEEGQDPGQVKGIVYRNGSKLCKTLPREPIEDLDMLPWPDYEGFDYFEIVRRHLGDNNMTAPLTTSRSCPFQCTFCSTSGGGVLKKYRQRGLDSIFGELEYLVEHYHVKEVFLNDELFAVNEERLLSFCERIKPFHIKWYVYLRLGKHMQLELLREMREAGCVTVFYGLESANDEILKSMKKGTTQQEMLRVLEITKEAGLIARGSFIFGDTQETLETAESTMNWVEEHIDLLETVTFNPIRVYPGSELYARAVKAKRIPDTVEYIRAHCPLVNPSERMDEDTYQILVYEKIPGFAARYRKKLQQQNKECMNENIIPDRSEGYYRHTFKCERCGNEVTENIYPMVSMFQHRTHCSSCGKQYELFPGVLLLQQYEREFSKMLLEERYAIWGMGETTQDFYHNNVAFQELQNLILIDSNAARQKIGFHGKKVVSPETALAAGVDKILCCTSVENYHAICKSVKNNIHQPKVVWLYEVLLE